MIEIQNLSRRFDGETHIHYKNLTFPSGSSCALLGASGCGKSTLLNMIAGVLAPTEGTILIDDKDVTSLSQREKDRFRIANIGYIYQDFKLIEEMNVEDNIRILEMERVDTSTMADTLDRLGILHLRRRRVSRLSGGEKQRVAIARAIVKKPSIILADEPTAFSTSRLGLRWLSYFWRFRGVDMVAVTHNDRASNLFSISMDRHEEIAHGKGGGTHA